MGYPQRPPPMFMDQLAQQRGRYVGYGDNSGAIAASSTGTINTSFNHQGKIYAIDLSALLGTPGATGATNSMANLDVFTIQFTRQNGDTLTTSQVLGTALCSPYKSFVPWRAWPIKLNETLTAQITNKLSGTNCTVYVVYHMVSDS